MSRNRIFAIVFVLLCVTLVVYKWPQKQKPIVPTVEEVVQPIEAVVCEPSEPTFVIEEPLVELVPEQQTGILSKSADQDLPTQVNRIAQLFNPYPPTLPIVETVSYISRVPWLTGRAAYLGDWASHYETSKHFISRSLNGMNRYLEQKVSRGDRFNVFKKDKEIEFHLVIDLSRLTLWLYYFDVAEECCVQLKSYPVCAGKLTSQTRSGSLTPTGVYEVGREIAVYKEGDKGLYKNHPVEMVTIFGVRWIPLTREVANCTGSCKGLGVHGVPWKREGPEGALLESRECIGGYNSQGCIRLVTEDIEEIFSIIVSKPSYVHIVQDFQDVKLPGKRYL